MVKLLPSCFSLLLQGFNSKRSLYIHQFPLILNKFSTNSNIPTALIPRSSRQIYPRSNSEAFVSALITALSSCISISHCMVIHARVIKSVSYKHGFIGDQLVSGYANLGCAEDAQKLFDEMPDKDLISWNSLISSFSRRRCLCICLEAFSNMKFEMFIKPNEVTLISIISACIDMRDMDAGRYIHGVALKVGILFESKVVNSLINMYGKSGFLYEACRLFDTMLFRNIVSWNSIISVHTINGFALEGVDSFNKMRSIGINPDEGTMMGLLQACEDLGLRKLAASIHGLILSCGLNARVTIATALLDLYAKLGILNDSCTIFREMINPDRVAWTAMLAAYSVHGFGKEAIGLFQNMVKEGLEPDNVTFTHLLSACSHSGLVKEGKFYFKIMSEVYRVEQRLDHYSCMVDLLGRCGRLNDAHELIQSMPMEPNSGVWGALLGACRVYGNTELGKEVAMRLFDLDPSDVRNYIMLSNIYSASHLWNDASKVRALMKERGVVRIPGCSFIEHGNKIHRFVVGDQSHPDSENIYNTLEELIRKIREAGFVSKKEFVLHDVDGDVKEDMINKHSEKLAIAYGLSVPKAGMPLVITKNIRICGDCHSFAKVVSMIEKRRIIVRDSKRFHHFSDGLCSCGDYW